MNQVINANNMDFIEPCFVSKTNFRWNYQEQLQILNNQKTLVGVEDNNDEDHSEIVIEDITNTDPNYVPVKFPTGGIEIYTILIDEERMCMFIGNWKGMLVEFSLDTNGYSRKIVKDYGDLGIGNIRSSLKIGNIAVFGGTKSSVALIDIDNTQNLGIISDLAVGSIYSIELCRVKNNKSDVKLLLTVTGRDYDYSSSKTDVLDITEFIKSRGNNGKILNNQHMIKQGPNDFPEIKALEDN